MKCPDCNLYELETDIEMNNKRCYACQSRLTSIRVTPKNSPGGKKKYVPIINVKNTKEYAKFFERYEEYMKNKTAIDNKNKQNDTYYEVVEFIKSIDDTENKSFYEISSIVNDKYPNISTNVLSELLDNNDIQYIKNKIKCNRKYKPYKNDITLLAKSRTLDELEIILCPEIFECRQYINAYLRKNEIPFIKKDSRNFAILDTESLESIRRREEYDSQIESEKIKSLLNSYTLPQQNQLQSNSNSEVYTSAIRNIEENTFYDEQDLVPAIEDDNIQDTSVDNINTSEIYKQCEEYVDNTLSRKYQLMKCVDKLEYEIEDIEKAIQIITDLKSRYPLYFANGSKQHEIMNDFNADLVHEIENINPLDDITGSVKLHILRKRRRDLQYNQKYINAVKPLIDGIPMDKTQLNGILNEITRLKYERSNPTYIPLVDMDIVNRYEYAKSALPTSKKSQMKTLQVEVDNANSDKDTYTVSYNLSGRGLGVYKYWFKEYTGVTEEEAKLKAETDLDVYLDHDRKGILIQGPKVTKRS